MWTQWEPDGLTGRVVRIRGRPLRVGRVVWRVAHAVVVDWGHGSEPRLHDRDELDVRDADGEWGRM